MGRPLSWSLIRPPFGPLVPKWAADLWLIGQPLVWKLFVWQLLNLIGVNSSFYLLGTRPNGGGFPSQFFWVHWLSMSVGLGIISVAPFGMFTVSATVEMYPRQFWWNQTPKVFGPRRIFGQHSHGFRCGDGTDFPVPQIGLAGLENADFSLINDSFGTNELIRVGVVGA